MHENSVDNIVTDSPYSLRFTGKRWGSDVPGGEIWSECLRVLKPGGYLLSLIGLSSQAMFFDLRRGKYLTNNKKQPYTGRNRHRDLGRKRHIQPGRNVQTSDDEAQRHD